MSNRSESRWPKPGERESGGQSLDGVPSGAVTSVETDDGAEATSDGSVRLESLTVDFDDRFRLLDTDWTIGPDEHWLIVGANGSGKSALAAVLAGEGEVVSGSVSGLPPTVAIVSYEAQAALIAAERRKDDADILDVIAEGTPARELLSVEDTDAALAAELIDVFGLEPLLDRAFRKLSTGETRKLLLVRALAARPDLLVLDEPFDGLDVDAYGKLHEHLAGLAGETRFVLVLNRLDEVPDFITHIAWMEGGSGDRALGGPSDVRIRSARPSGTRTPGGTGRLHATLRHDDPATRAELERLLHLKTSDLELPPAEASGPVDRPASSTASARNTDRVDADAAATNEPLVRLTGATIRYGDTVIFEGVDWTIERGEHWQLVGPNGSGKTGLLSLITGDHPQCYVNDIVAFGYRRGSGESIWDIKRHIGYVSTALQWEYTVGTGLRNVIVSGFHDSIGLYTKASEEQRRIADAWLALLGMAGRADEPFNRLSHGDRRLLLIARAMVKHPPLLILDEPCLGLDDVNRHLVLALIERICAAGTTTVLYVNHHAEDRIAGIERRLELGAGN